MKLGVYEITGAALRLLMRQAANLRAGVGKLGTRISTKMATPKFPEATHETTRRTVLIVGNSHFLDGCVSLLGRRQRPLADN